MIVIKMKRVVKMVGIRDNKARQQYETSQIKIQFFFKPGFHGSPVLKLINNSQLFAFHPAST